MNVVLTPDHHIHSFSDRSVLLKYQQDPGCCVWLYGLPPPDPFFGPPSPELFQLLSCKSAVGGCEVVGGWKQTSQHPNQLPVKHTHTPLSHSSHLFHVSFDILTHPGLRFNVERRFDSLSEKKKKKQHQQSSSDLVEKHLINTEVVVVSECFTLFLSPVSMSAQKHAHFRLYFQCRGTKRLLNRLKCSERFHPSVPPLASCSQK